jgi:hypothetical protein
MPRLKLLTLEFDCKAFFDKSDLVVFVAVRQYHKEIGASFRSVPKPLWGPFQGTQGLSLGPLLFDSVCLSTFL